jgi:hypothetical protein
MTAVVLATLSVGTVAAQDATPAYGSQLMTRQERFEYRNQMRALKTQEERNALRLEHHSRMQERAKEKGLSLPDTPPNPGAGMGPGMGGGMGPGMGGGMGPGMGGGMGPGMGGGMGRGRP